jgi:NAD+-dependent protein deacetylase SIR2
MGNENSRIDDSVPPKTLRKRSLSAVAELIKEGKVRRIVVMTGAGISTAAGSEFEQHPEFQPVSLH